MTAPYACHNRPPFVRELLAQDGWITWGQSRAPVMVKIPFVNSRECQYRHTDLGKADARCDGCTWRDR